MPFKIYREASLGSSRWTEAHWGAEKLGSIRYGTRRAVERMRVLNSGCFGCAANLVLQDTIERIFVHEVYADVVRGIFLVRGENVLLLGEIVRLLLRLSLIHTHSLISPQSRILTRMNTYPSLIAKYLRRKCTP